MAASPDLLSATTSLYCAEDAEDVASWDADAWTPSSPTNQIPLFLHDDRPFSLLLADEPDHMPNSDYLSRFQNRSLDSTARQDAVNWILKVHGFYRFRPVTAYLSANYLDRFLSSNTLPGQNREKQGSGWPMQLLSVACLSVAAKMEETHVPLLLDLQILEPRFVFEPRTIRRMELLLMAALRWRMRSITPFDFMDHFASMLPHHLFDVSSTVRCAFYSRASDLILSTHRVVDFLGYRPSAIAAAAILCAAGETAEFSAVDYAESSVSFYESVSKDMVSGCRKLMEEYLIDTCPSARLVKAGSEPPIPHSPVGVLDAAACGSCDTQKSAVPNSETSGAEPPSKRRKLGESRCTESIDIGDDGKNL